MKIDGISLAQLQAATGIVSQSCGAPITTQFLEKGGALDGYFKVHPFHPYATKKVDGSSHYGPCYHFYSKLVIALKEMEGVSYSFRIWLHHNKLTRYSTSGGKAQGALAKKGISCNHGGATPTTPGASKPKAQGWAHKVSGAPTTTPPASVKPSAIVSPTGTLLEFAPLVGDAVGGGDTSDIAKVKGVQRPLYGVIASLYILEECKIAALRIPPTTAGRDYIPDHLLTRALSAIAWRAQVLRLASQFTERLARNLLDFCVVACFGEARYSNGKHYTFDAPGIAGGRSEAYQVALKFDPRTLIPALDHCFNSTHWGGSFGGKKWGNIARAASLYFQHRTSPIVFIDHCVDLTHNATGVLAFNKGYIICNPSDHHAYMAMLDAKRHGSLFDTPKTYPLVGSVMDLVRDGVSLGLLRTPKAKFEAVEDKTVPTLKWGDKTCPYYAGAKTVSPVASPTTPTHTGGAPYHGTEKYPTR